MDEVGADISKARIAVLAVCTAMSLFGVALVLVCLPPSTHLALDRARSAELLGLSPTTVYEVSDQTIAELFVGPGTFDIEVGGDPFYGAEETLHLTEVHRLIRWVVSIALIAALYVAFAFRWGKADPEVWQGIRIGGFLLIAVLSLLGAAAAVGFDATFGAFHSVFFPRGGFRFDPLLDRIVVLYPPAFWQIITIQLIATAIALSITAVWIASRRIRRPATVQDQRP